MKRFKLRLVACMTLVTLLCTGCQQNVMESVASYPLASKMTSSEVVDYYAKALEYDSVISRNVEVHETKYNELQIGGKKSEILIDLTSKCENILCKDEYEISDDNLKLVSQDTFNYVKALLDNYELNNGKVQSTTGALGYYFVDVQYDVSPKEAGTFKPIVDMLGLDGAFYITYDGQYRIDTDYMITIVNKLNEYYIDNNIIKCAEYDNNNKVIKIVDNKNPESGLINIKSSSIVDDIETEQTDYSNYESDEQTDESVEGFVEDSEEASDDTTESDTSDETAESDIADDNTELDTESMDGSETADIDISVPEVNVDFTENFDDTTDTEVNKKYSIVTPASRRKSIDTEFINSVVGSSLRHRAIVPELKDVYNFPSNSGNIAGYGIYPSGSNGLKTFGYDRDKLSGTVTLRYVFKDDPTGTGEILGSNIYLKEEEMQNGVTVTADENVLIPEFLMNELKQVIERSDRAIVNCDIAALLSGNLYEDVGIGILRGYKDKNTNITKYMSTIRNVVSRDTINNSYLLNVETTSVESAIDVDKYGTYKDNSLVVVQQQDDKFIITDWVRTSRQMIDEPTIDPNSSTRKRLIALNLAGEISDDAKDSIKELISNLYTAGTNRILRGPKDITVNGQQYTIEKGMYDCFTSDPSKLSTEDLEYQNSTLRDILTKCGVSISSIYSGTVTEWIGGYENQAEFTTEELVTYNGVNKAYYMQVYYLVSIENDEWVIDERTVIDGYEITDTNTINSIKERVGQK